MLPASLQVVRRSGKACRAQPRQAEGPVHGVDFAEEVKGEIAPAGSEERRGRHTLEIVPRRLGFRSAFATAKRSAGGRLGLTARVRPRRRTRVAAPPRRRASASARSPATSAPRAPGEWSALVGATERLWRRAHLTYDETCEISKLVRARLELARPVVRRGAPPRLGEADQGRLISTAYRTASARGGDTRARGLMVKTLLLTGARVAEFVALRAEDLMVEEAQIRIRKGKGGKSRAVPLLPEHAHELRTHLGARRSGWLFETRSARPYSTRRVQQIVREVAARAGIVHRVSPHLLRHTVAQHLLDRGMPVDQVRQFLGHEDIKTTQIYAEAGVGAVGASYRRALGDVSARWAGVGDEWAASAAVPARGAGEPREWARPRGKEARPARRRRGGDAARGAQSRK